MIDDDDWDDDELPATGHDLHFLERVAERVDYAEADLVLRLYRDRALVRALLGEERSGAERVAIALGEGPTPPHAIVERGGAFVTCLGAGMAIGDRNVIPFPRVRMHMERADLLAERMGRATALYRDRAGVRQILERCDAAGTRLPREDFEQLVALAPILEATYINRAMKALRSVRLAAPHVLRLKRLPSSIEPKLRRFWNRFHAIGNYLLASSVRGKQFFEQWRNATIETPSRFAGRTIDPIGFIYFQPIFLGQGPVALRVYAAIARAGEVAIPTAKRFMTESPTPVRWLVGAYALIAIGRRHSKLRAELTRAIGPARLPPELRQQADAIDAAKYLQSVADAIWSDTEEAGSEDKQAAARRRLAEAGARGAKGEASLELRGDELSYARLAMVDVNFIAVQQDVARLGLAVAILSELPAEELYFPSASLHEAPDFTPEKAREIALIVPPPGEPVKAAAKPGRNEPCSCGSGKKFKRCCGLN